MSTSETPDPLAWPEIDEAIALGELDRAAKLLDAAAQSAGEDHPQLRYQRAVLAWEREGPRAALDLLDALLRDEPNHADAHYIRGLACEELDDREAMGRHFIAVLRLDTANFAALELEESALEEELDFIETVAEAVLDEVPEQFQDLLAEVPVVLESVPHPDLVREGFDPRALGMFEGLEHGRLAAGDAATAPTRIVLFYVNLLTSFTERDQLGDEIEITLLHEIGHYFGLDEDEVERLGLA